MKARAIVLILALAAVACSSTPTEPASSFVPCAIGYKKVDNTCVPR